MTGILPELLAIFTSRISRHAANAVSLELHDLRDHRNCEFYNTGFAIPSFPSLAIMHMEA